MKAALDTLHQSNSLTSCGKEACIIFYKGEHCFFCDAAIEMLSGLISEFGMTEASILQIDVDKGCDSCDDVRGLPAMRICDRLLVGLTEETIMRDALLQAMLRDCFQD